MEFNNFVRRKTVRSAADMENVWNDRSQTVPYKIMFVMRVPRNGGHRACPGTLKLLKHRLGLSQQKSLALTRHQQLSLQE